MVHCVVCIWLIFVIFFISELNAPSGPSLANGAYTCIMHCYAHDILTRNCQTGTRNRATGTRKLVAYQFLVPVFWYQFLVSMSWTLQRSRSVARHTSK